MLGLSSSTPSTDDSVTLNTADTGLDDFGQDVINGVIHELSEGAMGRVGGLGDQNGVWSTMDLFRYKRARPITAMAGTDKPRIFPPLAARRRPRPAAERARPPFRSTTSSPAARR